MTGAAHIAAGVSELITVRRAIAPECFYAWCGERPTHVLLASFPARDPTRTPARATLDIWSCHAHGGALKRDGVIAAAGWAERLARMQRLLSTEIDADAIGLRWAALGSLEAAIVFQNEGGL